MIKIHILCSGAQSGDRFQTSQFVDVVVLAPGLTREVGLRKEEMLNDREAPRTRDWHEQEGGSQ